MATYTLHLPHDARPGDATALDRAEVVKDGFAWWALVFQLFWFLRHRLWLGALFFIVATGLLTAICAVLKVHPSAASIAEILLAIFFALEANSIRRWTLSRNGRPAIDAVIASREDEAEARLFSRWLARKPAVVEVRPFVTPQPPATPAPAGTPLAPSPAVGLFPEPEGGR
jgi:hypothetical protein